MGKCAALKCALAVEVDVAAHLRLVTRVLRLVIVIAILLFLLIVFQVNHWLRLLVRLELVLYRVLGLHFRLSVTDTVEVYFLLAVGEGAAVLLAKLVPFIPLAQNRLEISRYNWFTGLLYLLWLRNRWLGRRLDHHHLLLGLLRVTEPQILEMLCPLCDVRNSNGLCFELLNKDWFGFYLGLFI